MREMIVARLRESAALKNLLADRLSDEIERAARIVVDCYRANGQVLLFGNGGSASDAQHIAAELVGRFTRDRRALPAVSLVTDTSILTAVGNDYGFDEVFARQVEALARPGDVVVAISTSGASPNVLRGVQSGRQRGAKVIALTGRTGGQLVDHADVALVVPSEDTARIQEAHITIGHILCELVERTLFEE